MSVQRSKVTLQAGVNRPGDPTNQVVPSAGWPVALGQDLTGCLVILTATAWGGAALTPRIQVSHDEANWTTLVEGNPQGTNGYQLLSADQYFSLLAWPYFRVSLFLADGSLAGVSNLRASFRFKADYQKGD